MHNYRLDPQTRARLRQLGRRRRRLILVRGLCSIVVSLTGAMFIVVAIDWLTPVPDWLRLAMSSAAYACVLISAWLTCGRLLLRVPSERQLARLVESGEPTLREQVISAVELGAPDADARYDSTLFRSLLQQHVAARIGGLRSARLLPWRLIRGWALAAFAMAAICVGLALVPPAQFRHRLARALLPTADLARLSRVQINVLRPSPPDTTVPHGESVLVEVRLSGREVAEAMLETVTAGRARQRPA